MNNTHQLGFVRSIVLAIGLLVTVTAARAQTGACCLGNGSCLETDSVGCNTAAGEFLGTGTSCTGVNCNGACCLPGETCSEGSGNDCALGEFQGAGSACDTHCAGALGTAFTHQGQLKQNGAPLSGMIDLKASLWTVAIGGDQVGTTMLLNQITVTNGLLGVKLDFGDGAFDGDKRWLELSVRSPHDPSDTAPFTTLTPRQPLTAAPNALFSSAPWQTMGTNISYNGGNVGIGTQAPLNPLHVESQSNTTAVFNNTLTGPSAQYAVIAEVLADAGTALLGLHTSVFGAEPAIFGRDELDGRQCQRHQGRRPL